MTAPIATGTPSPGSTAQAQLRKASQEMEALFYGQLLQSMRAALPKGGAVEASPGEEMFTTMLDDRIASIAATHSHRGVADALYRQMSARLPHAAESPTAAGVSNGSPR